MPKSLAPVPERQFPHGAGNLGIASVLGGQGPRQYASADVSDASPGPAIINPPAGAPLPPISTNASLPSFTQQALPVLSPAPAPQVSAAFSPPAQPDVPSGPLFNQLVSSYRSHGWSPAQAVNIASVQIRGEGAGLGTGGADVASGGSNGISQWDRNRWRNLLNWTAANNLDPRSVAGQTGFTTHELRTAYSNVDPNSIASLVHRYESPRSDLEPGEIARSQRFALANMANPGTPMSLPAAAQPPMPPAGQPAPPMAMQNPGLAMSMPAAAPPSAGSVAPSVADAASPPAAPAAAPQSDPWTGILAGIAQNLMRPPQGAVPPANPNVIQPAPSISSLLAGTHQNQVLA
jgi:hypothetical protein